MSDLEKKIENLARKVHRLERQVNKIEGRPEPKYVSDKDQEGLNRVLLKMAGKKKK